MLIIGENDPIVRLKNGDIDALGVLYDRFHLMVYRTALAITGDQEAASDLLQDVFLRLFRFADRIDEQRPLEPWLYRMTANLSYTWVKQSRRWFHPLEDLADWISSSAKNSTQDLVERRDDWDHVQKAVASLPVSQRVVVVLYYLNDLSLQEISEILEIPTGTVKSRLHYGRLALKKKLKIFEESASQDPIPDFHYEPY